MASSTPVEADFTVELELKLTGTFQPGCAAWGGSRFEPPINPPEPDSVEDVDIADIGISRMAHRTLDELRAKKPATWTFHSILDGVDRKSAAYRQIVSNLLALIGEQDAVDALLEAA